MAGGKESACNARDLGSIPELGRSLGEGKGYPLQYSGLENSMDCIVYGVLKSQTGLSDFHFHSLFHLFIYLIGISHVIGKCQVLSWLLRAKVAKIRPRFSFHGL